VVGAHVLSQVTFTPSDIIPRGRAGVYLRTPSLEPYRMLHINGRRPLRLDVPCGTSGLPASVRSDSGASADAPVPVGNYYFRGSSNDEVIA